LCDVNIFTEKSKEARHAHRWASPANIDRHPSHNKTITMRKESVRTRQTGWGCPIEKLEMAKTEEKKEKEDATENPQMISNENHNSKIQASALNLKDKDDKLKSLNEYFRNKDSNTRIALLPIRIVEDDEKQWGQATSIIRPKGRSQYETQPAKDFIKKSKSTLEIIHVFPPHNERRSREKFSRTYNGIQPSRKVIVPVFKADDFPAL
jgi:hypothetical protein